MDNNDDYSYRIESKNGTERYYVSFVNTNKEQTNCKKNTKKRSALLLELNCSYIKMLKYIAFLLDVCYTLFRTNDLNESGDLVANYTEEQWNVKKIELMEKCFNGFAELGLHGTGIRTLAKHSGYNTSMIYTYFNDLDDLIIQSTEYCMSKVEDEFMAKAPTNVEDLWRFIDEIPYWTAKKHGKKYRLMYQVYTHPKYREYGQKFFAGADKRYTEYAKSLEGKLGIPYEKLTPLIFILIRACVHYALFEDEFYMNSQIEMLKETLELFIMKYNPKARSGAVRE